MHLKEIGANVAPGAHAALVLDGAGYHVATSLAVPANITLVHQPPYAPELNPVEYAWGYLKMNPLANRPAFQTEELATMTRRSTRALQRNEPLLRSFLRHSPLFLRLI